MDKRIRWLQIGRDILMILCVIVCVFCFIIRWENQELARLIGYISVLIEFIVGWVANKMIKDIKESHISNRMCDKATFDKSNVGEGKKL